METIYKEQLGLFQREEAVKEWQENDNTHEMTCRNCENRDALKVFIDYPQGKNIGVSLGTQTSAKVLVKCESCGHVQENIPDIIYKWYFERHMSHKLSLGQLVEVEIDNTITHKAVDESSVSAVIKGTMRLFIVGYMRDCDGTPLYIIGDFPVKYPNIDEAGSSINASIYYKRFCNYVSMGHSEDSLKVIDAPLVKIHNTVSDYFGGAFE